ncbi:MAG: CotH kinase family protein [bacterium]
MKHFLCALMTLLLAAHSSANVVINEIMYNPKAPTPEYLELYNTGDTEVSLGGWSIQDAFDFTFPTTATIAAGGYVVLTENVAALRAIHPGLEPFGPYVGRLSNSGERIALVNDVGNLRDEVGYSDTSPWSPLADGQGRSLELIDAIQPNEIFTNWHPSFPNEDATDGTPGRRNSAAQDGIPPFPYELIQTPQVPVTSQTVTLDLTTVGGVPSTVTLWVDVGNGYQRGSVDLVGVDSDIAYYRSIIAGQGSMKLVRYYYELVGANGARRYSPEDGALGPNYYFIEPSPPIVTQLPQYFLFLKPSDLQFLLDNAFEDNQVPAIFYYNRVIHEVKARFRGRSSRFAPKKSWKFDFLARSLFRGTIDELNLNGEFSDPSLIRETLAYGVMKDLGLPYIDTQQVRLTVNGEYYGVMTEIEEPDNDYLVRNGLSTDGNLYKFNFNDYWLIYPDLQYLVELYPKLNHKSENDYSDLQAFLVGLNSAPPEKLLPFLEQNVDLERAANYFVGRCLISNYDDEALNRLGYHFPPEEGGKWIFSPWDLDLTMGRRFDPATGTFTDFTLYANQPVIDPYRDRDDWLNPLFNAFRTIPSLREDIFNRVEQALQIVFTEERYFTQIDALFDRVKPDGLEDPGRINSDDADFLKQADRLKYYVRLRRQFLLDWAIPKERLYNHLLGTRPATPQQIPLIDKNTNGKLDVGDLIRIINVEPTYAIPPQSLP